MGLTIKGNSSGVADVFYRTDLQKELPFSLKLNVLLNGEEATLNDLDESHRKSGNWRGVHELLQTAGYLLAMVG